MGRLLPQPLACSLLDQLGLESDPESQEWAEERATRKFTCRERLPSPGGVGGSLSRAECHGQRSDLGWNLPSLKLLLGWVQREVWEDTPQTQGGGPGGPVSLICDRIHYYYHLEFLKSRGWLKRYFPDGPVVESTFPMQGMRVGTPAGGLRSHMMPGN